jgi:hypothetical protein
VDGVVIDGIGVLATAIGALEMAVGGTEAAAGAAGRCGDLAFFGRCAQADADDSSGARGLPGRMWNVGAHGRLGVPRFPMVVVARVAVRVLITGVVSMPARGCAHVTGIMWGQSGPLIRGLRRPRPVLTLRSAS